MHIQLSPTEQYWIGWAIAIPIIMLIFLTGQYFVIKMAILAVLQDIAEAAVQGRTIN